MELVMEMRSFSRLCSANQDVRGFNSTMSFFHCCGWGHVGTPAPRFLIGLPACAIHQLVGRVVPGAPFGSPKSPIHRDFDFTATDPPRTRGAIPYLGLTAVSCVSRAAPVLLRSVVH